MTQEERIGREPIQKPGRSKQDYGTPWAFIRACAQELRKQWGVSAPNGSTGE